MSRSVCVIGSTGLIGKQVLKALQADSFSRVTAISRREIPELKERSFIKQAIYDFEDLESMRPDLQSDMLICSLGTTIKTAGSQARFYQIDHDIPLTLARLAQTQGCKKMILVSSVGADSGSRVFYSRVKGQLEDDLSRLGYEELHILRPSMLLGERGEYRAGESFGKLMMKPLMPLIPWKYKPIQAETLATTILHLAQHGETGRHVHEGKALFEPY